MTLAGDLHPAVPPALIGIDAGGSRTRGVRVEGERVVREASAGSANVASVGEVEAQRQLACLLDELGRPPVSAVAVGAAGADETRDRIRSMLLHMVPGARVRVVHDATLGLAASGLEVGVVLVSGTGSTAWGRGHTGTEARAGGWGYVLRDEGSGFWFGLAALRHALREMDLGWPPGPLTRRLVAACEVPDRGQLPAAFYFDPSRRRWAEKGRLVFELAEEGDPSAIEIVESGADALSALALTVAHRLRLSGPVLLAGGVLRNQPLLRDRVRSRILAAGLEDVRPLEVEPVQGAVRLAAQLLEAR